MIYGLPFWHYYRCRYAHNLSIHINIFGHFFAVIITKTPEKHQILLSAIAHFLFFSHFFPHFFFCFHDKNQLTFIFFFSSYYLTKIVVPLRKAFM
jgi:hypothetical protein